jgi:hypothetical protein
MKKLLFLMIIISLQSCSIFQSKSISINGFIENNSAYLGGTPPREGMEERLAVYNPTKNLNFYIRKDSVINQKEPILLQFKTDENGNYNINLAKGIYSVVRQEKIEYAKYASKTEVCEWLEQPDFILIIDENKNYKSKYTIDRNPCGPQIQ